MLGLLFSCIQYAIENPIEAVSYAVLFAFALASFANVVGELIRQCRPTKRAPDKGGRRL